MDMPQSRCTRKIARCGHQAKIAYSGVPGGKIKKYAAEKQHYRLLPPPPEASVGG